MMFLLFLTLAVLFTSMWIVYRVCRAGYWRPVAWLAWFLVGLYLIEQLNAPLPAAGRILVNMWGLSVLCLPIYWFVHGVVKHWRQ